MNRAVHTHFRRLETLYEDAPVSRWYGASIKVGSGIAKVFIPVRRDFHHAAHAVHGSVCFRALDDAAFFAANSQVTDVLLVTMSFHLHLLAPVSDGTLIATGRMIHATGRLFTAEAELRDARDRLVATGSGNFVRSRIALADIDAYARTPDVR